MSDLDKVTPYSVGFIKEEDIGAQYFMDSIASLRTYEIVANLTHAEYSVSAIDCIILALDSIIMRDPLSMDTIRDWDNAKLRYAMVGLRLLKLCPRVDTVSITCLNCGKVWEVEVPPYSFDTLGLFIKNPVLLCPHCTAHFVGTRLFYNEWLQVSSGKIALRHRRNLLLGLEDMV